MRADDVSTEESNFTPMGNTVIPAPGTGTNSDNVTSAIAFINTDNKCQYAVMCIRKQSGSTVTYTVYEDRSAYMKNDIDYITKVKGSYFSVTLYNNKKITSVKQLEIIKGLQYIKAVTYYNTNGKVRVRYDITNYVSSSGKWNYRINREVNYVNGVAKTFKTYQTGQTVKPLTLRSTGELNANGSYKTERYVRYNKQVYLTVNYYQGTTNLSKGQNRIKIYYNTSKKKTSYNMYYTNGRLKNSYTYYSNGKIKSITSQNYSGYKTSVYNYYVNGKRKSVYSFYKNGKVRSLSVYNQSGKRTRYYNYATTGKWTKRTLYFANGKIRQTTYRNSSGKTIKVI